MNTVTSAPMTGRVRVEKKLLGNASRRMLRSTASFIILLFGAIIMVVPFFWLVSSSFKPEIEIFQFPPKWIPDPWRLANYTEALTRQPFTLYIQNSLRIILLNEFAVLLSSSFCAYGFARMRFPGKNIWFGIVLGTMMLPGIILMIPSFVIFTRLGWVGTMLPLTVPHFFGGGAFNIFLFRQFFRTIPKDLSDAARIDGCNEFEIYWWIMLPLAKPALITVAIFTFLGGWNDLMGPLLYLSKPENYTVSLGLATFRSAFAGRTRWDYVMAASTAMTVPVIIVFFVLQRYFIKGIVLTGMKG